MPHICVVVNHRNSPFYDQDPHAREQSSVTAGAVCDALGELGHKITVVEVGPSLLGRLSEVNPDAVFNLATGYRSKKDQANIAAMLEMASYPFTGSGARSHLLGLHKHLTKAVMGIYGISTPRFRVIEDAQALESQVLSDLTYPVIVKPAAEGSSLGISEKSVAADADRATEQVRLIASSYGPPVLVEEYIGGREFTVGIVGYPEPQALPVEEIVFKKGGMYTYDVKSRDAVIPVCPAEIPPEIAMEIQDLAVRTFRAVGCTDVGRVDIRVSPEGKPYVLEINTLPGLMPGYSELPRMAEKCGMPFRSLVERVLEGALRRRDAS
ncbi:MAG: D-alanine--D-alanine ligase family protein [Bacillota bacterium]